MNKYKVLNIDSNTMNKYKILNSNQGNCKYCGKVLNSPSKLFCNCYKRCTHCNKSISNKNVYIENNLFFCNCICAGDYKKRVFWNDNYR